MLDLVDLCGLFIYPIRLIRLVGSCRQIKAAEESVAVDPTDAEDIEAMYSSQTLTQSL